MNLSLKEQAELVKMSQCFGRIEHLAERHSLEIEFPDHGADDSTPRQSHLNNPLDDAGEIRRFIFRQYEHPHRIEAGTNFKVIVNERRFSS